MGKKYYISEFIDNHDLVIKCDNLEDSKKAGSYLFKNIDINNWNPVNDFPIILWYTENGSSYNLIKDLYKNQTAIDFKDVIFDDDIKISDNLDYLIPFIKEIDSMI